jgi:hypothetical protein
MTTELTLDPDDASRLSFLAYTIEHYKDVVPSGTIDSIVDGLKTPEAQKIADAIRDIKADNGDDADAVASVYRGWIRRNARSAR